GDAGGRHRAGVHRLLGARHDAQHARRLCPPPLGDRRRRVPVAAGSSAAAETADPLGLLACRGGFLEPERTVGASCGPSTLIRIWRWSCSRCRSPSYSRTDRKSTRLNSSHRTISYAVFCLKKKK